MVRSPPCRFCRESLLQAGRDPRLPGQQGVLRSSCLSKQISCLVRYAGWTSAVSSRMAWEACRVVPHRRRDSSCHTQEAGVVLTHRWHMATGDKEGMAVTVSGTMAVNKGVWVGDPWCWSLCPPSWCF